MLEEIERSRGMEMHWNNPIYLTVKGARIGTKKSKCKVECDNNTSHKVLSGLNKSYASENLYSSWLTKSEHNG